MALTIRAAIAHKIIKEQHAEGTPQLRESVLPASNALDRLVGEIHTAYAKRSGKSHGDFESDEDNYPTAANLRRHFAEGATDFVETSHALMRTLLAKVNEASSGLATGGSVLMLHVADGTSTWFVVTILTDKVSAAIDDNLNLVDSVHLDLDSMRFAGRVDITRWLAGNDRYVSFLRGASREVSDYFQRFLGCTHPKALQQETKQLVQIVRGALRTIPMSAVERDEALRSAHGYLIECARTGNPLSIDTLSNTVWPGDPDVLRAPLADPDSGITDGFVPNRGALKTLVRVKLKTRLWQMDFDRDAVTDGIIEMNRGARTIVIHNVPEDQFRDVEDPAEST